MDNRRNQSISKSWAPVYDRAMGSFREIISNPTDLAIARDEPSLLHGQYRIVLLHKCGEN